MECLLLGIAATLIVPLFLKIADSKLIENIQIPAENIIKKIKQKFTCIMYIIK